MLLHRSFCAAHVVHQHHGVRHEVQVHADGRLDVGVDARPTAVARFKEVQLVTQVERDDVRAVRDSGTKKTQDKNTALATARDVGRRKATERASPEVDHGARRQLLQRQRECEVNGVVQSVGLSKRVAEQVQVLQAQLPEARRKYGELVMSGGQETQL